MKRELTAYSGVNPGLAIELRSNAETIRRHVRRTLDEMREVGRYLLYAKGNLKHGNFLKYVRDECGISMKGAERAMDVSRSWNQIRHVTNLPQRLVYEVAATRKETQEQIIELVKGGDYDVREVEKKCKEAAREAKEGRKRAPAVPPRTGAEPPAVAGCDCHGREVPSGLRGVFTSAHRLGELADAVARLKFLLQEYHEKYPSCAALEIEGAGGLAEALETVRETVVESAPATWCPDCKKGQKCDTCSGRGWMSQYELIEAGEGTKERLRMRGTEQETMF